MNNLAHFQSWEKATLRKFLRKSDGTRLYFVTQWNQCYGDLISSFQINDKNQTDVKCRYAGNLIDYQEVHTLCGERDFENKSITYEFLYKPLGLSVENVPATGQDGWMKLYTNYYFIREQLIKMGFEEIS